MSLTMCLPANSVCKVASTHLPKNMVGKASPVFNNAHVAECLIHILYILYKIRSLAILL